MTESQSGRRARFSAACWLIAGLSLLLVGCYDQSAMQQPEPPPALVTVGQAERQSITQFGEYAGRVRGAREVDIRAQVSGILEERRFDEGQYVEQGETLFQIEAEPYEIALRTAEAELANAQASLAQAEREWERVSGLFERDAVSERERDLARAEFDAAQARRDSAESSVADARRSLRYTRVEAPISGIAGIEALSEGNLIEPGMLLTHVTQHDPVNIHFSMPERDAVAQRLVSKRGTEGRESRQADSRALEMAGQQSPTETRGTNRSAARADSTPAWVQISAGGMSQEIQGRINFTDSRVDPATGTVTVRAEFPNPDRLLVPGQFVRVRIPLNEYQEVFLLDPTVISQGPGSAQVFTVDQDGIAHAKPVVLGPIVEGQQIVLDGLSEQDRLVLNGHVTVQDGAPVRLSGQAENQTSGQTMSQGASQAATQSANQNSEG